MFPHKLQKSLYSINNSCTAKLFKMKKTENLESSWKKKDSLQKNQSKKEKEEKKKKDLNQKQKDQR